MTNKALYRNFCATHPAVPVFLQPYWLDAVAENWDVVLVRENNETIAALPFCIKGSLLTKRIYLPDVSFYQSILFSDKVKPSQWQSLAAELFSKLPTVLKSYFKFLPKYATIDLSGQGFEKETYYTYLITQHHSIPLSKHHQRHLQKGSKSAYSIQGSKNTTASYELLAATFLRQKIKPKLSLNAFELLSTLVKKHACGAVMDCLDKEEHLLASVFIVEDEHTVYYLFGGYNTTFKNSGAMTYLLHHAIQQAQQRGKDFNFCGSSKKSIAEYFEGFGGKPIAVNIWKKSFI